MGLSVEWVSHIEAWLRSELKQADYCRQHHLNYHTFSARLSDYRKAHKAEPPALIPVQVELSSTNPIVLKYAQGVQVEFSPTTSAAWLAELLRCLN